MQKLYTFVAVYVLILNICADMSGVSSVNDSPVVIYE